MITDYFSKDSTFKEKFYLHGGQLVKLYDWTFTVTAAWLNSGQILMRGITKETVISV